MTSFEQATLETLVSFKAKDKSDIAKYLACPNLQQLAKNKVAKWDQQRIEKGLRPWNEEQ